MWRTVLVYGIRLAVASGVGKSVVGWLRAKLQKHVENLEARVNRDLDWLEDKTGVTIALPDLGPALEAAAAALAAKVKQ